MLVNSPHTYTHTYTTSARTRESRDSERQWKQLYAPFDLFRRGFCRRLRHMHEPRVHVKCAKRMHITNVNAIATSPANWYAIIARANTFIVHIDGVWLYYSLFIIIIGDNMCSSDLLRKCANCRSEGVNVTNDRRTTNTINSAIPVSSCDRTVIQSFNAGQAGLSSIFNHNSLVCVRNRAQARTKERTSKRGSTRIYYYLLLWSTIGVADNEPEIHNDVHLFGFNSVVRTA